MTWKLPKCAHLITSNERRHGQLQKARREILEAQIKTHVCKECGQVAATVSDYNGHGHMVCPPCYDSLTRYFESEYQ